MKRSSRLVSASLLAAVALSCSPTIEQVAIKVPEMHAVYPTGLKLVVMPDPDANLVEVDIRYAVGANQDPPGKAGLAHYVEHIMFQHHLYGPDKPATFAVLPQISVFFNAYTNWDTTHYMVTGRGEDWKTLLHLEAARMAKGCESIPDEEFAREREVVRNEIRQRGGRAESQILGLILSAAYPKGHPYEQEIGGNDLQLATITKQDVCDFMDRYYRPEFATVIVAGNVDPEQVNKEVDFAFGAIKKNVPIGAIDKIERPKFDYRMVTHELDVENDSLHVMWSMPPSYDEDGRAATALLSSLRWQLARFAEDWGFADNVSIGLLGGQHAPIAVISVEMRKGANVNEVLGYVWKAVKQAHRPFEGKAFKETVARQRANFILGMEPLNARTNAVGEMVQFNQEVDFKSGSGYMLYALKNMDSLTGDEIRSFIKRTLKKSTAIVVYVKAKEGAKKGDRQAKSSFKVSSHGEGDRPPPEYDPAEALKPLPVPAQSSALDRATRFTLGNGMKVVLLSASSMPVASVQLQFNVGGVHEPDGKEGIASLAADFLNPPRGMDAMGRIGLGFYGSADDDTTVFTTRGLSMYLKEMIQIMERMVKVGDYNQEQLEKYTKQYKRRSESAVFRERITFQRELANAVYGPSHPYARKGLLTPATMKKIGRDALYSFKKKHYTAANATLIISGNFDVAKAEEDIRFIFGSWGKGHKDEAVTQPVEQNSGAKFIGIVATDLPQVRCAVAYPSPAGIDGQQPGRQTLSLMINQRAMRIRTELGTTYGLRAGHRPSVGPGVYAVDGDLQATRAGESLAALRAMLKGLHDGDADWAMDFVRARRMILKNLLSESSVSSQLARRLGTIATYSLNPDYYDKLVRFVAAVSPAQVKALITSELKPENEVVVCMGGREKVEATFAEAFPEGVNVKYVDITK